MGHTGGLWFGSVALIAVGSRGAEDHYFDSDGVRLRYSVEGQGEPVVLIHGYGGNMNPCIDCHALMLRKAGQLLEEEGANFVITGEVLGQRPMSQNLKALSIVQNLGFHVDNFTTANFDMQQHYRPLQNVVKRPTSGRGRGYTITGHHEIMLPLLAAGILDKLKKD